jgi:multiple sugar transport system permease protein
VTIYTYAIGFRLLEVGRASALGVLTLIISALAIACLILVLHRRDRGLL